MLWSRLLLKVISSHLPRWLVDYSFRRWSKMMFCLRTLRPSMVGINESLKRPRLRTAINISKIGAGGYYGNCNLFDATCRRHSFRHRNFSHGWVMRPYFEEILRWIPIVVFSLLVWIVHNHQKRIIALEKTQHEHLKSKSFYKGHGWCSKRCRRFGTRRWRFFSFSNRWRLVGAVGSSWSLQYF